MPKRIIERIAREYERKGVGSERAHQIAYGAMNNRGAMDGSKETAKGRRWEHRYDEQHPKH
jgi:hypothetical protein